MTESKMYSQRPKHGNVAVMRYCDFNCGYCAFQKFQKISNCQACRKGFNHTHLEVLQRTPPKTKEGDFLTVGLAGDVSFMEDLAFRSVISYCQGYSDRTFLIQSKNPAFFLPYSKWIPDNVILGTTIETNRNKEIWTIHDPLKIRIDYADLSKAPAPYLRTTAMVQLQCKKAVTIEPILDFDMSEMLYWMKQIASDFIYIGYCNDSHEGKKLKLPEPSLEKTQELINILRDVGHDVREKTIRKGWYE